MLRGWCSKAVFLMYQQRVADEFKQMMPAAVLTVQVKRGDKKRAAAGAACDAERGDCDQHSDRGCGTGGLIDWRPIYLTPSTPAAISFSIFLRISGFLIALQRKMSTDDNDRRGAE